MLFMDFLQWWYGAGWAHRVRMLSDHIKNTSDFFSIGTLLKTMFSPWRQIVTTTRVDQSVNDKFKAFLDNLVSRLVGFFVRLFVLIAAIIGLVLVAMMNALYVVIWPIIPFSPIILITVGATL